MLNDQPTEIVRTTYCDDTVIWKVTQNGNTETASTTGDYSVLYHDLMYGSGQSVSTFDRVSGYDYEYMKTETETFLFTPEADDAAGSLGVLSILMGVTGLPYANAVAVAAWVVDHWGGRLRNRIGNYILVVSGHRQWTICELSLRICSFKESKSK